MIIKHMAVCTAIFCTVLTGAGNAFGIDSITVRGGDMQHRIALGMTEQALASSVGAPDIIKNGGSCYYYRVFDVSLMLDKNMKVEQIYAGRNFAGTVMKADGSEAPVGDIFKDFGEPLITVRRTYTPSTAIGSGATAETENMAAASGQQMQALPLEYRGQKKLYELYSGPGVLKYKYVLDEDGIAFWLDADKKPYATVIYRTPASAAAPAGLPMIYFDFDKDTINDMYIAGLDLLSRRLKDNATIVIAIDGHADELGTDAYNQQLSERRAGSVRDFFLSKGVPAERMKFAGFGRKQPVADNKTPDGRDNPEGRALNRRVQIRLVHSAR